MLVDEPVLVELRVVVNCEVLDKVVYGRCDVESLDVEHDNVYGPSELVQLDRFADVSISDIPVKQDNPASRNDVIRSY